MESSNLKESPPNDDASKPIIVASLFENPRDSLQAEDKVRESIPKIGSCPCLMITLAGINVKSLLDTGSQVTAISEEWYDKQPTLKTCPTLPITGKYIIGAVGAKSARIKRQIFAEIGLQSFKMQSPVLIIPGLNNQCILGIDVLREMKAKIDLKLNIISPSCQSDELQTELIFEEDNEDEHNNIKTLKSQADQDIILLDSEIREKANECSKLNSDQKNKFIEVIRLHRRVFDKRPGRIDIYEHHLSLKEDEPFIQRTYPIPISYRERADEEIKKMLQYDVIQRSNSPYINPLVAVIKKDGSVRLCLDARQLNKRLVKDRECAQNMETIFQQCQNVGIMSTLDLTSSFWQIPLHPDSRKYTAFLYQGVCYEYKVTPFGLTTSSAGLIRGLGIILDGLKENLINFVDDLLLISKGPEDHLDELSRVLQRLGEHNMTVNFKKCHFFKEETRFLGHIIRRDGISQDPTKLEAIKNFQTPRNIKQLRGFLGLVNFYSKFTMRHASETYPLLQLLRKSVKWTWSSEMEEAFQRTKEVFCEHVVLKHPRQDHPYYLSTDASDYALGAVIAQKDDEGTLEPLAFASRALHGAELSYFTTEKELLGIVWSLQKFRSYLLGSKIFVLTDHKALTF